MPNDEPNVALPSARWNNDVESPVSRKENDEKKLAKLKISNICSALVASEQVLQEVDDSTKLPAIADLCETLKQLLSHSGIHIDDAILEATPDFNTLVEIIKIFRSFCCYLNEICNILQSLLRIFQKKNSTQQLPQLQILTELSYFYLETTDYGKSIEYAQMVLNIANKLNVQTVQNFKADANYLLGMNYANQNVFEKALLHLDAYERLSHETGDELGKAKISFTRSVIARQRHEDEASLQYAIDFLEEAKVANDDITECKALLNIASSHIRLFNVQKSIHFCEECLQLARKICHVKIEMESKSQKATAYLALEESRAAYDMLMECLAFLQADPYHKYLECKVLNNLSYAALLLSENYHDNEFEAFRLRKEALVFIDRSISIFKSINIPFGVALAHLNKGLVFMKSVENHDKAAENFHEELRIGKELKSPRLIHNGYCGLGRLYEAKGERQIAEEYYMKALEIEDPPSTRGLQFSPDYLLALMYIDEKRWKDAAECLHGVIQKCKRQRRSVKDSLLKISFNDKLTKPYQFLQYAYLEMEATEDALVIGEEGRARDFYDKLIDQSEGVAESSPNPEDLLKISEVHNTAVLFLSQLTVVGRVYCWFIGSNGRIVDVFWVPQDVWKPLSTKLCVTMNELAIHWRNSKTPVEYRGVEVDEGDESSREGTREKGIFGVIKTKVQPCFSSKKETAGSMKDSRNPFQDILEITNEMSELFLKPIEHHLEEMVKESKTGKPSLLIIPQENTFNIPYAALRLKNGKHLCNEVALLEAFSFYSYIHSTKQMEATKDNCERWQESLIIGNPTNDLPELPCAQKEAEMVAELLGVNALIGRFATRSEIISHLSSAPIIHFACHGSNDGRRLFLAPEKECTTGSTIEKSSCLTVDDVSQLNVHADMVVLSACHSARGKISIEGVLGLARAFLMAGAKSVVTALWAIPDNATMTLMKKFYKNLQEMRIGDALSTTMCQMQEEELFKHVIQWGSFKVLGANVKVSLPKKKR